MTGTAAEDGAGLGGRGVHGRVPRVVAAPAGVAPGSASPPDRQLWRYGLEEKPRGVLGVTSSLGRGADLRVTGLVAAV